MAFRASSLILCIIAESLTHLPPDSQKNGYYSVSFDEFKECSLASNALRQGLPVLVKGVYALFDEAPFTPAALRNLANRQNRMVILAPYNYTLRDWGYVCIKFQTPVSHGSEVLL